MGCTLYLDESYGNDALGRRVFVVGGVVTCDPAGLHSALVRELRVVFGYVSSELSFSDLLKFVSPGSPSERMHFILGCLRVLERLTARATIVASRASSPDKLLVNVGAFSLLDYRTLRRRMSAKLNRPGFTPSKKVISDLRKVESVLQLVEVSRVIYDRGLFLRADILSRLLRVSLSAAESGNPGVQLADFVAGLFRYAPIPTPVRLVVNNTSVRAWLASVRQLILPFTDEV